MKTAMRKTMSVPNWIRIGSIGLAATALSVVLSMGCDNTAEGDPCDIALSHDECSGAPTITCTIPANCQGPLPSDGTGDPRNTGNAYCCGPNSTVPTCLACAAPAAPGTGDAGTDGAGE